MIKESQKTDIQKKKKISGSDLQKKTLEILKKTGWIAIRVNSVRRGKIACYSIANTNKSSGFPDVLGLKNNQALLLEIKGDGDRIQPSQEEFMRLCKLTNNDFYIIESVDDVINVIKKRG